jgi:hypothetical protein
MDIPDGKLGHIDGFYPFDVVPSSVEGGTGQSAKWPLARFSILLHSGALEMQILDSPDMDRMVVLRRLREWSKIIYEPSN